MAQGQEILSGEDLLASRDSAEFQAKAGHHTAEFTCLCPCLCTSALVSLLLIKPPGLNHGSPTLMSLFKTNHLAKAPLLNTVVGLNFHPLKYHHNRSQIPTHEFLGSYSKPKRLFINLKVGNKKSYYICRRTCLLISLLQPLK